jgi:hypothetical protein
MRRLRGRRWSGSPMTGKAVAVKILGGDNLAILRAFD